MEYGVLQHIYNKIVALRISKCDVYLEKPTFMGKEEKRNASYISFDMPNGIEDMGAFGRAGCGLIIGTKDKVIGLPNMPEINRIAAAVKSLFPLNDEVCSAFDFEFTSDSYDNVGAHEFYYTFQIYINK